MSTRISSRSMVGASAGVLALAFLASAPAQAAQPSFLPSCANLGHQTANGSCVMPGTLGSGKTVSIAINMSGGGGGGGIDSPYAPGGSGAAAKTYLQVPEGVTVSWIVGQGGRHSNATGANEGASGGGSSAILLGSSALIETGGGGGATNDVAGGGAHSSAGSAGDTACSGRGGNSTAAGAGGAAGSLSGPCVGTGVTPTSGTAGHTGIAGTGGAGGQAIGGSSAVAGGAGYAAGGSGGGSTATSFGGGGGGGGYGGGGGGTAAEGANGGTGAGGGGGSYIAPSQIIGGFGGAGNGGSQSDGGNGQVYFESVGPSVKTLGSPVSGITKVGATLHSIANANGSAEPSQLTVVYNTAPSIYDPNWIPASAVPSTVSGTHDTAITTTLTHLTPCTTYYYAILGASTGQDLLARHSLGSLVSPRRPAGSVTFGSVQSFSTLCQLPLTVVAVPGTTRLPRTGSVTVVTSATTTSQGRVLTMVRCTSLALVVAGDIVYCHASVGAHGSVTVTTLGYPSVKVTVTQQAVPLAGKTQPTPSVRQVRSWVVS